MQIFYCQGTAAMQQFQVLRVISFGGIESSAAQQVRARLDMMMPN
jgi:hypothetical protein